MRKKAKSRATALVIDVHVQEWDHKVQSMAVLKQVCSTIPPPPPYTHTQTHEHYNLHAMPFLAIRVGGVDVRFDSGDATVGRRWCAAALVSPDASSHHTILAE
jgi:hypothetical protein